jgi:ribosomal protein S18 acetylase RimI-like enzyme
MSTRLSFVYEPRHLRTPALSLDYYLVPWDTQLLGVPVAQIAEVHVLDSTRADSDLDPFLAWCSHERVALCAARVPAERSAETLFLEDHGFRFIELNYQPRLTDLGSTTFDDEEIRIEDATQADRPLLTSHATEVFRHGRFHQDPRIDPALGDRRYGAWLDNAYEQPHQQVLKCVLGERIVGFFVVETPNPGHCHWALNALAPGLAGTGLGKRVWCAMLARHRAGGIHTVTTSISSHNVAAFNLYVALGFRFPVPSTTLHWCPRGSIAARPQP